MSLSQRMRCWYECKKAKAQNAGEESLRLLRGTVRFARTHPLRTCEILFLAFSVLAGDYGILVL